MTLAAAGVTYRHPGHGGFLLPPTDLTVREGRITAVLGPSGSGKTTLAYLLTGLLSPDSGSVTCDGEPLARSRGRLPGHTALLHQNPVAAADPRMTLRRMITSAARTRSTRPVLGVEPDKLAFEVGLDPRILDRRPGQVSGGQLQRACLARALAQRPRYLVADEATAHLDPESTAAIAGVLRARAEEGLGVLAVTHDHRLAAEWADDVYRMC